jgi:uncharacterized protein YjiS (DUF1127 family)
MTLDRTASTSPALAWRWPRFAGLRAWFVRRQTRLQIDALDDRMRRDIGLEPTGLTPTSAANAAARIAMMASR